MEEDPHLEPAGQREIKKRERKSQEQEWIDMLFGETPDAEIGSTEEQGWFGLLRNIGKPGGLLLCQTNEGFRNITEIATDEDLAEIWAMVDQRYTKYYESLGDE